MLSPKIIFLKLDYNFAHYIKLRIRTIFNSEDIHTFELEGPTESVRTSKQSNIAE